MCEASRGTRTSCSFLKKEEEGCVKQGCLWRFQDKVQIGIKIDMVLLGDMRRPGQTSAV
jgi:hypothetical protein